MDGEQVEHQRRVLLRRPGHDFGFNVIGQNGVKHGFSSFCWRDPLPPQDVLTRPIPTLPVFESGTGPPPHPPAMKNSRNTIYPPPPERGPPPAPPLSRTQG